MLSLILLAMVVSGCSGISAGVGDGNDNPGNLGEAGENNLEWQEEAKTAEYSYQYANMALKIPEGWEYSIVDSDNRDHENTFGIIFWPEDEPSMRIQLLYYANGIGLCGTGVTFEDITLENGLNATKCTEEIGGDIYWLFLIYKDVPGYYAAGCNVPKAMWDEYGDMIMSILGSAELGKDMINEEEAVEIARADCIISYKMERGFFDYTSSK